MSLQTGWFVENQVVFLRFEGVVEESDLFKLDTFIESCCAYMPSEKIYLLVDARDVTLHCTVQQVIKMKHLQILRYAHIVTVGAYKQNRARVLIRTLMGLLGLSHQDYERLEEACEAVCKMISLPEASQFYLANLHEFYDGAVAG